MTQRYCTSIAFHPVGQGMFSTGSLFSEFGEPSFEWFFDCGTASKKAFLTSALRSWRHGENDPCCHLLFPIDLPRKHFALGAISHFDQDHISGVSDLQAMASVGLLLLPYATLAERLIVAFSRGARVGSDLAQFCANPVAFARDRWKNVRKLVFVRGGVARGPDAAPNAGDGPQNQEFGRWRVYIPPLEDLDAELSSGEDDKVTDCGMLQPGSVVRVGTGSELLWEFQPYNDKRLADLVDQTFTDEVIRRRSALLRGEQNALAAIKELYDQRFGKSAKRRNQISLFLLGRSLLPHVQWCGWTTGQSGWGRVEPPSDPMKVLYTGDALLNTSARVHELTALGLEKLVVFQVPHHGSRESWMRGLASRVAPRYSVICADPHRRRPGHPHGEVLRDFLTHGVAVVDTQHSFGICQVVLP